MKKVEDLAYESMLAKYFKEPETFKSGDWVYCLKSDSDGYKEAGDVFQIIDHPFDNQEYVYFERGKCLKTNRVRKATIAEIAKATQLSLSELSEATKKQQEPEFKVVDGKTFPQRITFFEDYADWKGSNIKPMQQVIKLQTRTKNNSLKFIKQKKHGNY